MVKNNTPWNELQYQLVSHLTVLYSNQWVPNLHSTTVHYTTQQYLFQKLQHFHLHNFAHTTQRYNTTFYLLWVKTCRETRAGINRIFQFMFHILRF